MCRSGFGVECGVLLSRWPVRWGAERQGVQYLCMVPVSMALQCQHGLMHVCVWSPCCPRLTRRLQVLGCMRVAEGKPRVRAVLASSADGSYVSAVWPAARTYAIFYQGATAWQE